MKHQNKQSEPDWATTVAEELVDRIRETRRDGLNVMVWQDAVVLVASALRRAAKYPNG